MILSAWDTLQPHSAWLEQVHVQPHHGTALLQHTSLLSPLPEAFPRFQHSVRLCPPILQGMCSARLFPGWGAGLAVLSMELLMAELCWVGHCLDLEGPGFWSTERSEWGCSWILALAGMSLSQELCLERC